MSIIIPLKSIALLFLTLTISESKRHYKRELVNIEYVTNVNPSHGQATIGEGLEDHNPHGDYSSAHGGFFVQMNENSMHTGHGDGSPVRVNSVNIPVAQPYPVTYERRIPVEVRVPVNRAVPVEVPQPYPVTVIRRVPVTVNRPVPYTVRVPVEVPIIQRVEVPVPRPYPVLLRRPVEIPYPRPIIIESQVPVVVGGDNNDGGNMEKGLQSFGGGQFGHNNHELPAGLTSVNGGYNSGNVQPVQHNGYDPNHKLTSHQFSIQH